MHRLIPAIALAVVAAPAIAQTTVNGTITMIRTGWNDEQFAVVTNAPVQNPARCPAPDGYISHRSNPGYQTYLTTALAGFTSNSQASVVVHNSECGVAGRPKLIGINLIQTNRTSTVETEVNRLAGNVNQMSGSLTQIATRVDHIDQLVSTISPQFHHPSGRSLMNILGGIWNKVGCPDNSHC
jgi:hypothetical protein